MVEKKQPGGDPQKYEATPPGKRVFRRRKITGLGQEQTLTKRKHQGKADFKIAYSIFDGIDEQLLERGQREV